MDNVLTNENMRKLDRYMIEHIGIPGVVLMENAAMAVADSVINCGKEGLCAILIGPGNNGGDGLALLRILLAKGRPAVGILLCDPERLTGDAHLNYSSAKQLELPMTTDLSSMDDAEVIVDAVFGTGLCRELSGIQLSAIRYANKMNAYRIAVDIPSGINGDTGKVMGDCFDADETVAVFAIKRGLLLTERLESVGRITVARIGLADESMHQLLTNEQLIDEAFVKSLLPERKRVSNKGSFGRTLVIAGSRNMPGAAVMCTRAAMRAGSGLTKAFVPTEITGAFAATLEAMVIPDDGNSDIGELLNWSTAAVIGCGIGNDEAKYSKLRSVLLSGKPAVIDADALNTMDDGLKTLLNGNHILTPHPGEMSRLTGEQISAILADPVSTALNFAKKHSCTVLMKNAVSVIASPDGRIRYNTAGNPGLAKGGSGDVLAGIVAAQLANGLAPFDAASVGAFLLGSSADKALELLKNRMLLASDVIEAL